MGRTGRRQGVLNLAESIRLHEDWWGKCRTCTFWGGDREHRTPGPCGNSLSPLRSQETWTEGHCPKWDTFDVEGALAVLDMDPKLRQSP